MRNETFSSKSVSLYTPTSESLDSGVEVAEVFVYVLKIFVQACRFYSFIPLVAIPSIKYFCPNRYSARVGTSDTVAPAITTAQSVV